MSKVYNNSNTYLYNNIVMTIAMLKNTSGVGASRLRMALADIPVGDDVTEIVDEIVASKGVTRYAYGDRFLSAGKIGVLVGEGELVVKGRLLADPNYYAGEEYRGPDIPVETVSTATVEEQVMYHYNNVLNSNGGDVADAMRRTKVVLGLVR